MELQEFYNEIARYLDTTHEYHEPPRSNRIRRDGTVSNSYKTRWNGREPGNGRFPGHGLVRHFGAVIQVALTNPPLTGTYASTEEVLEALWRAVGEKLTREADARIEAALDNRPPRFPIEKWELRRLEKLRDRQSEENY